MKPPVQDCDRRISVKEWHDEANVSFGSTQVYETLQDVWAGNKPTGPGLFYGTQQVESSVTHQYFFRRTVKLNEGTITQVHVVEDRGLRYRVKRAVNIADADEWMQLDVEQLGKIAP